MLAWFYALQDTRSRTIERHRAPRTGPVPKQRLCQESNALFQPVYPGVRKDVEHHGCVLSHAFREFCVKIGLMLAEGELV